MPRQKPGASRQDYGTPWEFIRAVEARFGSLVHDLAAHTENMKCVTCYTEELDSLVQPWAEHFPVGNLWLNPPFADIEPWAVKCLAESKKRHGAIFMLTPASVGSNWFIREIHGKALVIPLSPRLTFDGTSDPYPKDLMLTMFSCDLVGFAPWRWKE